MDPGPENPNGDTVLSFVSVGLGAAELASKPPKGLLGPVSGFASVFPDEGVDNGLDAPNGDPGFVFAARSGFAIFDPSSPNGLLIPAPLDFAAKPNGGAIEP